jgi:hypothetical protein
LKTYFEEQGASVTILKLAKPLYHLQQEFYRIAGISIQEHDQDQVLLEMIASQLRRISSTSLIDDFSRRLAETSSDVIINDDLRDPHIDYPALKNMAFKFMRIHCPEPIRQKRLYRRGDLSMVVHSTTSAGIDLISPDWIIENVGDFADLRAKVIAAVSQIL